MIKDGTVVSLSYRLTNAEGEEIDRADASEPFHYLHGKGQIVTGLERALTGLKVGEKKKVTVPPSEGYGEIEAGLRTQARRQQFPAGAELTVGMQFAADTGRGQPVVFTITDIQGDEISLDGNHPLAGETLNFDVEVLGVRDATKDEMAHGHAHGAHGHDHDH